MKQPGRAAYESFRTVNTERNKQKSASWQAEYCLFYLMSEGELYSTIGGRCKEVRESLRLTQSAMADRLSISLRSWQTLERNEGLPSGETLLQFYALKVNPGWILTGLGGREIGDETVERYQKRSTVHTELMVQIAEFIADTSKMRSDSAPDFVRLCSESYNRLIERADDPTDVDEIKALLPWLKRQLEKSLDNNNSS